jgi:hypothetical protein
MSACTHATPALEKKSGGRKLLALTLTLAFFFAWLVLVSGTKKKEIISQK